MKHGWEDHAGRAGKRLAPLFLRGVPRQTFFLTVRFVAFNVLSVRRDRTICFRGASMRQHLGLNLVCGMVFVIVAGIASAGDGKKGDGKKGSPDYYPLRIGNQWEYRLTVNDKPVTMINRIAKTEKIGDTPWFVLEAEVNGKVTATEHLRHTEDGLVRLRTNTFEASPPLLLLKRSAKPRDKWGGEFEVKCKKAKYTAEVKEDTVQVPAGKFKTIHVAIRLMEG